jgi:hypothetical protein
MHTVEQGEAEARLRDHVPPLPGTALYFGLREDFALVPDVRDPELLGLPRDGEEGLPFDRVAWRRLGGDERALRLVLGYLQSYSHLMDDLGRPPTSEEFANRWRFSLESVRDDEALFRQAFPEEDNPERILRLLDRALPRAGAMARLMGVRVTDRSPTPPDPLGSRSLVSGQRWRSPDGASFISVIESVDGDSFVGAQHDQDSGSSVLVTGTRETLAGWRLDIPGGVWRVSFDVQQAAPDLLDRLSTAGVVVNRLARPGDPRPGRGLPSASVEVLIDGADENDARTRVFRAMHGLGLVDTETLYIRPVG